MTPKAEAEILEHVLAALHPAPRRAWRRWLVPFVLWLGAVAVGLAVLRSGVELRWPHFLLAGGSFVLGVKCAYDFYLALFSRQWPLITQYIDRERLERRLAELRAGR